MSAAIAVHDHAHMIVIDRLAQEPQSFSHWGMFEMPERPFFIAPGNIEVDEKALPNFGDLTVS